jgi:hypothetical protein
MILLEIFLKTKDGLWMEPLFILIGIQIKNGAIRLISGRKE